LFTRSLGAVAFAAIFSFAIQAGAQQQVPPAPDAQPATSQPDQAAPAPSAPAPAAPAFPKPDPANFTAASPTKETVDAFMRANWGFDDNRMWQVQAIVKTPVDGLSKVIVLFGDRTGKDKPQALAFFVLPDGKHIITGDQVIDFGANPFAEVRDQLKEKADGPYRGAPS
jgi:hypothetical protein